MTGTVALLDANVLYAASTRDIFMDLAVGGVFRARWTAEIHREWIEALLRNQPRRRRADLERTRDLMDRQAGDCLVAGYEPLIPTLALPDPKDRHVLAAAIVGRCDTIATRDLRHFPREALAPHGLEAIHPDEFLRRHFAAAPEPFLAAARRVRARLRNPPFSAAQYLDNLARQGLPETAAALRPFAGAL